MYLFYLFIYFSKLLSKTYSKTLHLCHVITNNFGDQRMKNKEW